jgi:hypothetical protein
VPNQLNANVGDHIIFKFGALNHTLTQSTLENPCARVGRFDSGFDQFNPTDRKGLTLALTVNSLEPQWFFCRQDYPSSHCHAGMVFALNPGDKMGTFLANVAREGSGTAIPSPVVVTVTKTIPGKCSTSGAYGGSRLGTGTGSLRISAFITGQSSSVKRSISAPVFTGGSSRASASFCATTLASLLAMFCALLL